MFCQDRAPAVDILCHVLGSLCSGYFLVIVPDAIKVSDRFGRPNNPVVMRVHVAGVPVG